MTETSCRRPPVYQPKQEEVAGFGKLIRLLHEYGNLLKKGVNGLIELLSNNRLGEIDDKLVKACNLNSLSARGADHTLNGCFAERGRSCKAVGEKWADKATPQNDEFRRATSDLICPKEVHKAGLAILKARCDSGEKNISISVANGR